MSSVRVSVLIAGGTIGLATVHFLVSLLVAEANLDTLTHPGSQTSAACRHPSPQTPRLGGDLNPER